MKATIKFVKEVEIAEQTFIKIRFNESFPGFKQNQDGDFVETEVNEVVLYKSTALAMFFEAVPTLALAYSRTERFNCIEAALQGASCELKRQLVRDENADHDRYETRIENIVVSRAVKKILDEEIAKAFS